MLAYTRDLFSYAANLDVVGSEEAQPSVPAPARAPFRGTPHMECVDNMVFMRSLPPGSMKLIATSPPYNIGKAYERRKELDIYVSSQAQVIAECVRLLHPQGSICW
jgi:hypothetical protein